jgi:hypothetical protein
MDRWIVGFLALVVAATAVLVLAVPAGAITFGPAVTVSAPAAVPAAPPAVAVSAAGDVVVAWSGRGFGGVYAAYRRRGGSFAPPQLLSRRRVEGSDVGVGVTGSGEAFVVWAENETLADLGRARARVVVTRRAVGDRRFGRPFELSRGQAGARAPWLGVTPRGEAMAVWEQLRTGPRGGTTGSLRVTGAIRAPGAPWGAAVALSDRQRRFGRMEPRVAVLPSGAALAVWQRASGGACCQRVEAAVRPAAGAFGAPVTLGEAAEGESIELLDAEAAGARWGALIWHDGALQLVERPELGDFADPQTIPGARVELADAALALAADGAASVLKGGPLASDAVCSGIGGVYALSTSSRPAGGTFRPDHPVTPSSQPGASPRAAVAGGRAIFAWIQPQRTELEDRGALACNRVGERPHGSEGSPGADPGPGMRLPGPGPDARALRYANQPLAPTLAADPRGPAVLAWIGGNARVRIARIGGGGLGRNRWPDIVAPELRDLRLRPTTVSPGGRLQLTFQLTEPAAITIRISRRGGRSQTIRVKRRKGRGSIALRAPRLPVPFARGGYSLEVVARDAAGNVFTPTVAKRFAVR